VNAQDTLWQRLEEHAKFHDLLAWMPEIPGGWTDDLRAAAQIVREHQSPEYDDQTIQPLAEISRLHAELTYERQKSERLVAVLVGIHGLMYPPRVAMPDGRVMEFRPHSLDPHESMQKLSDRIREIPDKLAAIDAARKP